MKLTNRPQKIQKNLRYFIEPKLKFGFNQSLEDPKDGLLLFGPFENSSVIEYGVIGTCQGVESFNDWSSRLNNVIHADKEIASSVTFPGFQTIFRSWWKTSPNAEIIIDETELLSRLNYYDPYERVYNTVSLYYESLKRHIEEEDERASIWFVVIPEEVWKLCRPQSNISKNEGTITNFISHKRALILQKQPSLFKEENTDAEIHLYEKNFHNQLKARLLGKEIITQIVRETTIAPDKYIDKFNRPIRSLQDKATVAWNLCTSIYYKSGKKPWSLASLRKGVCYIGLVFKQTSNPKNEAEACCGAQLFLSSGDGIVFKGSVGSFKSEKTGTYHLSKEAAKEIIEKCVKTYCQNQGSMPTELYIHGRTHFNGNEISGFEEACPEGTEITGIQIHSSNDLKLFRQDSKRPIMRGHALDIDSHSAFLWTSGYIPHLKTYPGREIPNPLRVRIVFGKTSLRQVLEDIMVLTKLNFNSCIFADGFPVTLRFADGIGEILTAIPKTTSKPLPFRNYI